MADPIFTQAEYDSLRANLKSQAKAWADYTDYAYESDIYKGTLDPSSFRREHEAIGAQQQQQLGARTRTAIDREISQGYARTGTGVMGGRQKAVGRHLTEDAARRARIMAEVESAGEADIEANAAKWRSMMEKAGALKGEVLSAQQQLAVRLGEHGRTEDFWYYETDPDVMRFYESAGMTNASRLAEQKAQRVDAYNAAGGTGGNWKQYMATGQARYLPETEVYYQPSDEELAEAGG